MNYLERYINGEYEHVWSEHQALGPAVRKEPHYSLAREVAAETMRRVRRNCEMIVSRLRALGYVFGVYPCGLRSSAGVACRAGMARHLGSNPSMFWLRVLNRSEGWGGALDGAFGRRSDMT